MKKGQSNWSIASLCSELVAKMAKDIGMTIRKGIVVPFLPCLVAFWGFHPYMFFHFFLMFFCYFIYISVDMLLTIFLFIKSLKGVLLLSQQCFEDHKFDFKWHQNQPQRM